MQLLPWWDWRPLHHQRCLVSNPHFVPPPAFSEEECVACEAVDQVDRVADTTYQHLLDAYLQRNAPVVVEDAMDDWPVMRAKFGIHNLTQVRVMGSLINITENESFDICAPCIKIIILKTYKNFYEFAVCR